jgi:hypothetical protein
MLRRIAEESSLAIARLLIRDRMGGVVQGASGEASAEGRQEGPVTVAHATERGGV